MDISYDIIERYLKGDATLDERCALMDWVEESERNEREFNALRKIYDASLLLEPKRRGRVRFLAGWRKWAVAAAVAAVVGAGLVSVGRTFVQTSDAVAVSTVSAPAGQRTKTVLADGTVVWLNSGSEIRFSEFTKKERVLHLDGEAYLEVARDESRPFVVETSRMSVTVLGTKFNVNAYSDIQTVVLLEGSVCVSDPARGSRTRLVPGQKLVCDTGSGKMNVTDVRASDYVTWVEGYFLFDNEPLCSVLERLRNAYGVEIVCDDPLVGNFTINGKLFMQPDIFACLDNIRLIVPISYERADDGSIHVMKNNK
ncbi:MAG: FecR domain-containing protein [Bacteroidales bacterium]|nr:FecR domain-containing protein [Bacteroidales bacterium]